MSSPGKYQKGKPHPQGYWFWRMVSSNVFRRQMYRWRLFILYSLFILGFALVSRYYHYKRLWNETSLAGDNLEPTPWQPHNDTVQVDSFWERLSRVRRTAGCLHRCPLPLKALPEQRDESSETDKGTCPTWFQFINEDLQPWGTSTGITSKVLEAARPFAAFRVIIVSGRLHIEHFYKCPESRAMFTLWGLAVLLRRFPGQVPDVDLMFDCTDHPRIDRANVENNARKKSGEETASQGEGGVPEGATEDEVITPLLIRYSGSANHSDVVFPDWSFWGWPEARVPPWEEAKWQIANKTGRKPWRYRDEVAHWKGHVGEGAPSRDEYLACNGVSSYKTEIEAMGVEDGEPEVAPKYDSTQMMDQSCGYRYKIFPSDAASWTVHLKYLMACGSVVLRPPLSRHDFFSRALQPGRHFWPIQTKQLCHSIRFAVEFGNSHVDEALKLASAAQAFVREDLALATVYHYMLHFLQAYAELQTFQPEVPKAAQEVCPELILCLAEPSQRDVLRRTRYERTSQSAATCNMLYMSRENWEEYKERSAKLSQSIRDCEKRGYRAVSSCTLNDSL